MEKKPMKRQDILSFPIALGLGLCAFAAFCVILTSLLCLQECHVIPENHYGILTKSTWFGWKKVETIYPPGMVTVGRKSEMTIVPSTIDVKWEFQSSLNTLSLSDRVKGLFRKKKVDPKSIRLTGECEISLDEVYLQTLISKKGASNIEEMLRKEIKEQIEQDITETGGEWGIEDENLSKQLSERLSKRLNIKVVAKNVESKLENTTLSKSCTTKIAALERTKAERTTKFIWENFWNALLYVVIVMGIVILIALICPDLLHLFASIGSIFV